MKRCPFKDCSCQVQDLDICCSKHWQRLPETGRHLATRAMKSYLSEEITLSALRVKQQVILEDVLIPIYDAEFRPFTETCRCGHNVLVAMSRYLKREERLEQVTTVATPQCFVVIGGYIEAASARTGAYTKFKPHFCRETDDANATRSVL